MKKEPIKYTKTEKTVIQKKRIMEHFGRPITEKLEYRVKIRLIGVEPITFGTEIQRSIQFSYKRKVYSTLTIGLLIKKVRLKIHILR